MLAYGLAINPIPGVEECEVIEKPILPPAYIRGPGRLPKLSRNIEPDEQHRPPPGTTRPALGIEKLPMTYYQEITCGRCNKKGHNSRSCERREAQSQTKVESSSSQNQGNGVHVERTSNADNVQPNTCVRTQRNKAPTSNEKSHYKPNWKP
ncbi:PREDICTED: uncharacterized protein LOC101292720 [Fragaria vesca subsp. vesca]|uniref:uncharacterized protein LOC101292720 n=1 Tax=Fragaria vesca subsp. vesca TaxID=101020 RepID=UPI0002C31D2A|nr:PREDICTED: uncharacterized protein LOC101292720 [Fragaria vesca subsp. vesca]